jgi:ABC-type glutathione transport system ATPase component
VGEEDPVRSDPDLWRAVRWPLLVLGDIRRETGVSNVFISHNLAVVRQVTDDLVVMRNGQVLEAADRADP